MLALGNCDHYCIIYETVNSIDFSCGVIRHQSQALGSTQGARQLRINLSGKNRVLPKCFADSTVRPWKLALCDTSFEQGCPRDIEHCVVGAIYCAVSVFVL